MVELVNGAPFQRGHLEPVVDVDSKPWWDGLAEGRLLLPRCLNCGRYWFPPSPTCPACGADHFEWASASGRGSLYSWVVVRRALHPAFADDVPYTVVAVDLDEGPRVLGRLLVGQPEAGAQLEAVIFLVEGTPLLGFRPAARRRVERTSAAQ